MTVAGFFRDAYKSSLRQSAPKEIVATAVTNG
jgi:hypothetical protein